MSHDDSLPEDLAGDLVSIVIPGSGSAVSRLFSAVRDEWNRNRSVALKAAERTAGMSREDLAERIEAHPDLVPLVTRLLWEAAMTGQGPLLEAMGAAFGAAVDDSARAEEYELVLGGLRNLRGDDVRILRHLHESDIFFQQSDAAEVDMPRDYQTVRQMAIALPFSEQGIAFGLIRLVNQGFGTSMAVLDGTRFEISELGRLLFDALERMNNR